MRVDAKDYASATAAFFGNRPQDNPGYSKMELIGEVKVGSTNRLDVLKVEQRLKYLGFGAPTGQTDRVQRELKVDGAFGQEETNAVKHFEKILRFRYNGQIGYGTVGDGNFSSNLNNADGKISPTEPVKNSRDAASGNSLAWLNAYNAPHWMNLGSQMQYQNDNQQANYSLVNWQNTQTGVADRSSERYAASWMRDLMRAHEFANPLLTQNISSTGSRVAAATDANIFSPGHASHQLGMNFDLSISKYLDEYFMSGSAAVSTAISTANLPDPLASPVNGWRWSMANGQALLSQLPNESVLRPDRNGDPQPNNNFQANALKNFLALYALTRSDDIVGNGTWDDLPVQNGLLAKVALFGRGTKEDSLISRVIIGSRDAPNEAKHARMREVLSALGVNNITWNGHQNHFHVDLQAPPLVRINTVSNLQAQSAATALVTSLPSLQATAAPATPSSPKYAAIFGACQFVDLGQSLHWDTNHFDPFEPFGKYRELLDPNPRANIIRLITPPQFGSLTDFSQKPFTYKQGNQVITYSDGWHYIADESKLTSNNDGYYFGKDQAVFEIEAKGKKYKVIFDLHITGLIESLGESPSTVKKCKPTLSGGARSWRISGVDLNSNDVAGDLFRTWQATSELNSLLSTLSSTVLVFDDLPATAVGQTTGEGASASITLDTNAAGHGWYIDPTPLGIMSKTQIENAA